MNDALTDEMVEIIAAACHQVNKAYCEGLGDRSQKSWNEAPDWQKESARVGVIGVLMNGNGPEQSHESWLKQKEADGWVYGPIKNEATKTHPCMLPYDQLPEVQKRKDWLFVGTVQTLARIRGRA